MPNHLPTGQHPRRNCTPNPSTAQRTRHKLLAIDTADSIASYREELATADTPESIRLIESQAAGVYRALWRPLSINFPRKDMPRLPDHWRTFGSRVSPLTRSPRLAVNPPNAMLNYLYTLLESESRLAAAALGLDPVSACFTPTR